MNIQAQLSDRVRVRFTPDVRPTTDANLDRNLTLRLEYAQLDAQRDRPTRTVMFGMHETPWLTFEESVNRYRVLGTFFCGTLGLIPGPDRSRRQRQGHGRDVPSAMSASTTARATAAPKSTSTRASDGRVTVRPFDRTAELGNVRISGFYSYGWYAKDRPRNVAIVMGSYEKPACRRHRAVSARRPTIRSSPWTSSAAACRSSAKRGRVSPAGPAFGGVDFFNPDVDNDGDAAPLHLRRRALEPGGTRPAGHRGDARSSRSRRPTPSCSSAGCWRRRRWPSNLQIAGRSGG